MLDVCRAKGAYRHLIEADLTGPLAIADGSYDAMICVGVMGAGHLVPEHFAELFRTVKRGGPIVLFGNGTPYVEDGYAERFAALDWTIERTETTMAFSCTQSTVEMDLMLGRDDEPVRVDNLLAFPDYVQYVSRVNRHASEQGTFEYSGTSGFTARLEASGS